MAKLYIKQAKQYAQSRPSYPPALFEFIASKTPNHDLVWDVGTGSGQAAKSLAGLYKNVIATDASQSQLEFAPKLPNVRYQHTPPIMSTSELERNVASQSSVDLVAVGQALHWFDLPSFYQQAKWVLKKPHGVIAAWCYTVPQVNACLDKLFHLIYFIDSKPYWDMGRHLIFDNYRNIDFPFQPVDGLDHTGPFEFKMERLMDLGNYLDYIRSGSAYQKAKDSGIELLTDNVIEELKRAWSEDGNVQKVASFPVFLRIGKHGNLI